MEEPETLKEKLPVTEVPGAASLQISRTPVGASKFVKFTTVSLEVLPGTVGATTSTVAVPLVRLDDNRRFGLGRVVIALTATPDGIGVSVTMTGPAGTGIGPEQSPTGTTIGFGSLVKVPSIFVAVKLKFPVTGFVVDEYLQTST